jgi:large repetitive protein
LVLPLFLLLSFSACELKLDSETKNDDGTFWAYNIQFDTYYQVTAAKVYEGEHCIIYRENGEEDYLSDSLAVTLGQDFDNNINNQIINSFGNPSDVDRNGKIVLLALDIRDGFSGSGGYVAGYFDPTNTYSANTYAASNEKDMLYLDTYPGLDGADTSTFRETMAHEYQHLINYYQKVFVQNVGEFDLWINEGMSSAAEKIYAGAQITSKIQQYSEGIGGIENGRNFISWTGDLDSYATVYLFFQWLGLQSSQGDAVYKTIMSQSATDYSAVQTVAEDTIAGAPATFSELLGAWFAANYIKASSGLYGYKGNAAFASLNPPGYSYSFATLKAGEGVYSTISTAVSPFTYPQIVYMGVSADGTIDTTSPYTGEVLITYNGSGFPDGNEQIVNGLPTSVVNTGTVASLASKDVRPDRYRIDVQFGPDGRPHLPGKAAR